MARLEDFKRGASIKGILPDACTSVVDVKRRAIATWLSARRFEERRGGRHECLLLRKSLDLHFTLSRGLFSNVGAHAFGRKSLVAELLLMQRPKRIRSSLRTGSPRPWVPLTKRTRWAVGFVIVALAALVNRRRASPTQNKAHLVRWD